MAKLLRFTLAALVVVGLGITLVACNSDGPTAPPAPPLIIISGPSSVAEGEFACYKASVSGDPKAAVHFGINPAANMTTDGPQGACFGSLRAVASPYTVTVTGPNGSSSTKMLEVTPRV